MDVHSLDQMLGKRQVRGEKSEVEFYIMDFLESFILVNGARILIHLIYCASLFTYVYEHSTP